jgi:hypothetical protein
MIRVPKGGEGEVVALEDRSSDKKSTNSRNHNSNKSNNEHTAIQPQNATTKSNAWIFIVKY